MAYDFEAFQKFGKEQFDAASAAMSEVAKGLQAIATEAGDYSKKSFEDSSALVEKLVAKSPIGRLGTVAEAAEPIVFLLTDAASFVNGHILVVDGGRLAAG